MYKDILTSSLLRYTHLFICCLGRGIIFYDYFLSLAWTVMGAIRPINLVNPKLTYINTKAPFYRVISDVQVYKGNLNKARGSTLKCKVSRCTRCEMKVRLVETECLLNAKGNPLTILIDIILQDAIGRIYLNPHA